MKIGQRVIYRSTMRELWPAEITYVHPSGLMDVKLLETGVGHVVERRQVTTCPDDSQVGCILIPKERDAS